MTFNVALVVEYTQQCLISICPTWSSPCFDSKQIDICCIQTALFSHTEWQGNRHWLSLIVTVLYGFLPASRKGRCYLGPTVAEAKQREAAVSFSWSGNGTNRWTSQWHCVWWMCPSCSAAYVTMLTVFLFDYSFHITVSQYLLVTWTVSLSVTVSVLFHCLSHHDIRGLPPVALDIRVLFIFNSGHSNNSYNKQTVSCNLFLFIRHIAVSSWSWSLKMIYIL